jgi:putative holliday junction resolvase
MTFLGIDYGQKRHGIAKSDELGLLAQAIGVIEAPSERRALNEISDLVKTNGIGQVVVGLPKTLKGEIGSQADIILNFVDQLKKRVSCAVITWDERLTTAEAEKVMLSQDMSRAKRNQKRDAAAAEIMLQSYLDYIKESELKKND